MAKAIECFTGKSSYGVPENYAKREDGEWFTRHYGFNGYGMSWLPWRPLHRCLDDKIQGDILAYGNNPLTRIEHKRLRLPG